VLGSLDFIYGVDNTVLVFSLFVSRQGAGFPATVSFFANAFSMSLYFFIFFFKKKKKEEVMIK
jgi:hypothetical protein